MSIGDIKDFEEMSSYELEKIISYLYDEIHDDEVEEEWMEECGTNHLPLLRGLIEFLEARMKNLKFKEEG